LLNTVQTISERGAGFKVRAAVTGHDDIGTGPLGMGDNLINPASIGQACAKARKPAI